MKEFYKYILKTSVVFETFNGIFWSSIWIFPPTKLLNLDIWVQGDSDLISWDSASDSVEILIVGAGMWDRLWQKKTDFVI